MKKPAFNYAATQLINAFDFRYIHSTISILSKFGERGCSVVECQTLEPEVGGSKPTSAMLCP